MSWGVATRNGLGLGLGLVPTLGTVATGLPGPPFEVLSCDGTQYVCGRDVTTCDGTDVFVIRAVIACNGTAYNPI
jgi:hypothetical protein